MEVATPPERSFLLASPDAPLIATSPAKTQPPTLMLPEPTATTDARICPPLPGYSFEGLAEAVSNPFNPPPPGSDDPHQAVDFAVQEGGIALAGGPVQAVMGGRVAGVIHDRFPYGNAILVEVPLESMPAGWLTELQMPTVAPTLPPHPSLTCPAATDMAGWDASQRSLYLLYAHLSEITALEPEDRLTCGDAIGRIGQSGNALNPHLHLEARLGPAMARFSSLAHYESSATPEEMSNYCIWRVSGVFQLVDPMRLLAMLQLAP